jgi:hypothetical protein
MNDQSKTQKPKKQIDELELNKETVQDLAEGEAELAQGGRRQCSIVEMTIQSCFCTMDPTVCP